MSTNVECILGLDVVLLLQDWMCTSSMCDRHIARVRGFCLSCLSTAGPAHSTSSTRSYHCSQRPKMALHLRSYAHPSLAMASQRPRTNKVHSPLNESAHLSLSSRCLWMFLHFLRVWQSRCCPGFPDSDGAFGILTVLPARRRLGLPHHHQHGTDEATVWGPDKVFTQTCISLSLHWNFHHPCFEREHCEIP